MFADGLKGVESDIIQHRKLETSLKKNVQTNDVVWQRF